VRERVGGTKAEALAHLVASRVKVFESNAGKHERKVFLWWVSVGLLAVGLVFSVAAIVQTDHHGRPAPVPQPAPDSAPMPVGDAFIEAYFSPALISSETKSDGAAIGTTSLQPPDQERR